MKWTSLLTCLGLAAALPATPVQAESQDEADALVRSLSRPAPPTRSLRPPVPVLDAEAAEFLRGLPTRGLSIEARAKVAEISTTYELPQVDIDILFDFGKDTLNAGALRDVITLGRALSADELAGQRFVVAGHTDSVGSAAFNLDLSQRRAETVREFLVENFEIPAARLIAVGFGFEQLKLPQDPRADENRRVELINLEVGWE